MSSKAAETGTPELQRAEVQAVLQSGAFARATMLARLLSYLCEKMFAGEGDQIKEYSIALDVFGRDASFDQDSDSIVRVQANRLRKRLADYYASEGVDHNIQITIPVGQYVPVFVERPATPPAPLTQVSPATAADLGPSASQAKLAFWSRMKLRLVAVAVVALACLAILIFLFRSRPAPRTGGISAPQPQQAPVSPVGLPVGDEIRILAGATRGYVDHSGKLWSADSYFAGGAPVRTPVPYIWRTQDPTIYRTSRQGDFAYNIPLKPGTYELHLHFAETFYGPEDMGGGGEGSRMMSVTANGYPLLTNFDVLAEAGDSRTAEVKVFTNITPAADDMLHLNFSSVHGGRGMLSAIEILPGVNGRIRPVRIVSRDTPYYSNDSHWWSPDTYFKGGRLAAGGMVSGETDDPELYESERWGHFSYAIPVAPGRYTVVLHFVERRSGTSRDDYAGGPDANAEGRVFNVFCNGKAILRNVNVLKEAGESRPLVKRVAGLEPNAQGKLLLEFVPVKAYATVTALEVIPQ